MTEPIGESLKQMRFSRLCCPVVELRQYTLHPGKRDVLIDLFDREFVESQEALGIKIIGQSRITKTLIRTALARRGGSIPFGHAEQGGPAARRYKSPRLAARRGPAFRASPHRLDPSRRSERDGPAVRLCQDKRLRSQTARSWRCAPDPDLYR